MRDITAQDINKLVQATGASMMNCRKILIETNNDFEVAIDLLSKQRQKVVVNSNEQSKSNYVHQREDKCYDDEITEAEVIETETNEEIQVQELIKELKSKPNKSKKDQYNIELLEIKLKQLRSQK
jgi:hypothetical protein